MAEANTNEETREQVKCRLRFCEVFHGRFNTDESRLILESCEWDVNRALNFVLTSPADEISRVLQEPDEGEWVEVRPRVNRRRRREDALRDENLRQLAAQNDVPAEVRQFACEPCDSMWWRKVPGRKMVSKCYRCRRRYEALPRDLEWGWAKFVCRCNAVFHGFGAMGRTLCLCYTCNQPVWPESILPPRPRPAERRQGGRRRDDHSCLAPDCLNRPPPFYINAAMLDPNLLQDLICVHPRSLTNIVVEESEVHNSTGSTVDTFLTQGDLDNHDPLGVYIPRVPVIREDNEDGGARP